MGYIYRLAGENLELAEGELEGFLQSQGINEEPIREGRIAETNSEPSQLKRLGNVHEVSKKVFEGKYEDFKPDFKFKDSFKVKIHDFSEDSIDKKRVAEELGEKISGEVNLENPSNTLHVYFTDKNNVFMGLEVLDNPRTLYNERKNQERPFSSPVSMSPILARTLVNLSGVKPGETLFDPMCGTGGILIEAGLVGVLPKGIDVKKEMIEGSKENLEEYGILNYDIEVKNIKSLERASLENIDVIVCDLPYGKASKIEENPVETFLDLVEDFDGRTIFMYNKPKLKGHSHRYSYYVHGSLTRYIFVA